MNGAQMVLVTPRDPNPYQQHLYQALEQRGWTVRYCDGPTASQTLNVLAKPLVLIWHRAHGFRLLHVHWIYDFSLPWARSSRLVSRCLHVWFRWYLFVARVLGIRIVWTAHNVVPHREVFANDRGARGSLVAQAHVVIALSHSTTGALGQLGARDVRVIPFGRYESVGDDDLVSRDMRAEFGIADDALAALFVGRIEPYKGLLDLIEAVHRMDSDQTCAIVAAGECRDSAHRRELVDAAAGSTRCHVKLRWLGDAELTSYLRSADVAVFPFRTITNSSSIVLALCHGVPIVAPRLAGLRDLPEAVGFWYEAGDVDGLRHALERASRLSREEMVAMRVAALEYAASLDWNAVGIATEHVYEEVLAR